MELILKNLSIVILGKLFKDFLVMEVCSMEKESNMILKETVFSLKIKKRVSKFMAKFKLSRNFPILR